MSGETVELVLQVAITGLVVSTVALMFLELRAQRPRRTRRLLRRFKRYPRINLADHDPHF